MHSIRGVIGWITGLAVAGALVSCEEGVLDVNHMPVVLNVTYSPTVVLSGGDEVTLRVDAIDEDGDDLSYSWSSDAGSLVQLTGQSVSWQSPEFGGDYEIRVNVSDGQAVASAVVRVSVTANQASGTITVNSNPQGAQVVLDGVNTEFITPFELESLPVGDHTVSLHVVDCDNETFAETECVTFPTSQTELVTDGEDVVFDFTFVTSKRLSFVPGPDTFLSPPQVAPTGGIVWSDDVLGSFALRLAGVADTGPGQGISIESFTNYDGEIHFPNWRFKGVNTFIVFQTTDADLGSEVGEFNVFASPTIQFFDLGGDVRNVSFNPTGTRFAFVRHTMAGSVFRTEVRLTEEFADPVFNPSSEVVATYDDPGGRVRVSTPEFGSDGNTLVYSVTQPGGSSDLYLHDFSSGTGHRLSTDGQRAWPTFSVSQSFVFYHDTGADAVYGAELDTDLFQLGPPMRLTRSGTRTPAFTQLLTNSYVIARSQDRGIIVVENFDLDDGP